MLIYLKSQKLRFLFLILLFGSAFACSKSKIENKASSSENSRVIASNYQVRRLTGAKTVNVGDSSLADWDSSLIVMEINLQDAFANQWKDIRGRKPSQLAQNDFGLKVYMARDNSYWYIAVDVSDDKVLPSALPYSGDCLEIFFAGKELDSPIEIHRHVSSSGNQAAFFQLEIPPASLQNTSDYFPEYRTDSTFINSNPIRSEFMVSMWNTDSGWRAEAKIPLDAFELDVLSQLNGHQPLKINIDYLDYDGRPAERNAQDNWGFNPDNVFCLDDEERSVNVPKYMPNVIFE